MNRKKKTLSSGELSSEFGQPEKPSQGKTKSHSEHWEQVQFVSWFRKNYGLLIFAIPNGGWRHPVVARKLKNEGVVKGMPDLCIPAAKLFIEMKREKGGHVSEDQKKVRDNLVACGYIVMVCKGQEEAKAAVLDVIGKRD